MDEFLSQCETTNDSVNSFTALLKSQKQQMTTIILSNTLDSDSMQSLLEKNNKIQLQVLEYTNLLEQVCIKMAIRSSNQMSLSKSKGGNGKELKDPPKKEGTAGLKLEDREVIDIEEEKGDDTGVFSNPSRRSQKTWKELYQKVETTGMNRIKLDEKGLPLSNFCNSLPNDSSAKTAVRAALCMIEPEATATAIQDIIPADFGRNHPLEYEIGTDGVPPFPPFSFPERMKGVTFVRQKDVIELVDLVDEVRMLERVNWKFPQIIEFQHRQFTTEHPGWMHVGFVTYDPSSHLFCRAFCKDSSGEEGAHLRVWRVGTKVMDSLKKETTEQQNKGVSIFFGGKIFPYSIAARPEHGGQARPSLTIRAVWSVIG